MNRLQKEHVMLSKHFEYQHNNPPAPFNAECSAERTKIWREVVAKVNAEQGSNLLTNEERADKIRVLYLNRVNR